MAQTKMHEDEIETDISLVHRLLAAQFPLWADLRGARRMIDEVLADHEIP